MQLGIYFDQTRCTGCGACSVACKDWNDIPAGPENWMRILYIEKGRFPDVFVGYLASPCYQCESPVCAEACPADAIVKSKNGIVAVDSEACLGNEECNAKCLKACPYDAPQFGPEKGAKMKKCDLCESRWAENKLPVCVEACPVRALDAGPIKELEAKYGGIQKAEGFEYSRRTRPAVVFKPKFPGHQ